MPLVADGIVATDQRIYCDRSEIPPIWLNRSQIQTKDGRLDASSTGAASARF